MNLLELINSTDTAEINNIDRLQFQNISSLMTELKFNEACQAIESSFDEKTFDIRVIIYYYFISLKRKDVSCFYLEFKHLHEVLDLCKEKLTPEKNFNKHLTNSLSWFFKTVLNHIKYLIHEKKLEVFDFNKLNDAIKEFSSFLKNKYEIDIIEDIKKIADTLVTFNQIEETEKDSDEKVEMKEEIKIKTSIVSNALESEKWRTLKRKISIFRVLMEEQRFLEAALFFKDINKKIKSFDPREYFPAEFFPLYEVMTKDFEKVLAIIDKKQNTLQWHIVEQLYNVDPEAMVSGTQPFKSTLPDSFTELSQYLKQSDKCIKQEGIVSNTFLSERQSFNSSENFDDSSDIPVSNMPDKEYQKIDIDRMDYQDSDYSNNNIY